MGWFATDCRQIEEAATRSCRAFLVLAGAALAALTLPLPAPSRQAQKERIVFESNRFGNSDVWIANVDGTGQQDLTRGSAVDDISPALSPNGKLIVFARVRGDRSALWLMNSDGSNQRRLGIPKGSETHPAWSPTSDRIAFVRLLADRWDVVVTDLQGIRRALTNDVAAQYDVSWSPKGDRIVFDQLRKASSDLWTIPSTGGLPTQITKTPGIAELNPAWSPAADEIAYDAADAKGRYDLYVLDLATHETRRITRDAADDGDPTWSPSGTKLAYRHEVGDDYEIAKVEATGNGKPSNVSHDPSGLDLSPSWQVTTSSMRTPAAVTRSATSPLWTFACDAAYPGTPANNTYTGTSASNHMCGQGGNDTLYACGSPLGTADFEKGHAGTDHLWGWNSTTGKCTTLDRGDWLRSRWAPGDIDDVHGGAGFDRALTDPGDVLSSIEEVDV